MVLIVTLRLCGRFSYRGEFREHGKAPSSMSLFGGLSKAAAWPHRLEEIEKRVSSYVEKQGIFQKEIVSHLSQISNDITRLEGRLDQILSEARSAAQSSAVAAVSNDLGMLRERLTRVELSSDGKQSQSAPRNRQRKLSSLSANSQE